MRKPVSPEAPRFGAESLSPGLVLADLNLTVVTPMFGGGVETRVIDESQIIRPSAVRGQLRCWWRACNAARFDSLDDMHREERLLWGSVTKKDKDAVKEATWGPGLIGVSVIQMKSGQAYTPTQRTQYVTWPFQQDDPQDGRVGVEFRLRLTVGRHAGKDLVADKPDKGSYLTVAHCEEAAAQALWAWIAFGGVGSRTRRGCGSLYCTGDASQDVLLPASLFHPPADRDALTEWLQRRINGEQIEGIRYVPVDTHTHSLAMLAGCRIRLGVGSPQTTVDAWVDAINGYKDFLQGEDIARTQRPNPNAGLNFQAGNIPGQSWWPEVQAARGLLNANNVGPNGHEYKKADPLLAGGKDFPRADLGLPRKVKVEGGDGGEAVIQGETDDFKRMASPVVIKALAVNPGRAVPVVLQLNAPHVWDHEGPGVELVWGNHAVHLDTSSMTGVSPDWPFPANTPPRVAGAESARDAFMRYLHLDLHWDEVIP